MFLHDVPEESRKSFIDLAYTIMGIDSIYAHEERVALRSCQEELELPQYQGKVIDLNDVKKMFTHDRSLRGEIYFELLCIVLSDSEYSDEEVQAMKLIREAWNIPDELDQALQDIVRNINRNYARACVLLSRL